MSTPVPAAVRSQSQQLGQLVLMVEWPVHRPDAVTTTIELINNLVDRLSMAWTRPIICLAWQHSHAIQNRPWMPCIRPWGNTRP